MSHEAVIKFAPVFTLERFNDPKWPPDRRMYEPGALKLLPGTDTVPLIVDHDDDREIGTVQKLHKWDWPGGPWIFASATVTAPPPWLKRGTRVSFGSKVIDRRDISIREYQADVVALAFVEEVSVLSPSVQPAEPCAESCRFAPSRRSPQVRRRRLIAPPSASPTTNAAGVGRARAPPRLPSDDANQEQAFVEASRRPIDRYYDEFMAVKRQREPEVIVRHNIGQVLGVR